MKKYLFVITLALCTIMAVSCGNNSSSKAGAKKSKEEIKEAKIELAESVLATIDSLEQKISETGTDYEDVLGIITSALTDDQKLVKPDYLLDPALTADLLSIRQKVNALAILITERPLREAYGLPVEQADKAIASLYLEVGHPIMIAEDDSVSMAKKIKMTYQACKENDDLCFFWQFDAAIQNHLLYLISFNSDAFFNNITPEQYKAFHTRMVSTGRAAHELAEYDSDIASAVAFHEKVWDFSNIDEADSALSDMAAGKAMIESRKQAYIEYRDWALL